LGNMTVVDDKGQRGILSGMVRHQNLRHFNLRVNMNSEQIEVLNLRDYENANFYGNVDAAVTMRVTGPWENLNMNIFATPAKNARLFIPIADDNDLGEYEYIHFKEYGQVAEHSKPVRQNKFSIRLDVIANP